MLQLKLRIIEKSQPCTVSCCELVTDQTVSLMCGASAGGAKMCVGAGNISESKAIFSLRDFMQCLGTSTNNISPQAHRQPSVLQSLIHHHDRVDYEALGSCLGLVTSVLRYMLKSCKCHGRKDRNSNVKEARRMSSSPKQSVTIESAT